MIRLLTNFQYTFDTTQQTGIGICLYKNVQPLSHGRCILTFQGGNGRIRVKSTRALFNNDCGCCCQCHFDDDDDDDDDGTITKRRLNNIMMTTLLPPLKCSAQAAPMTAFPSFLFFPSGMLLVVSPIHSFLSTAVHAHQPAPQQTQLKTPIDDEILCRSLS
jgi:hypothetical protein